MKTAAFKTIYLAVIILGFFAFSSGLTGCGGGSSSNSTTTTWYKDSDGDGYGLLEDTKTAESQPLGYVSSSTDCNDNDPDLHPGAVETCGDGIDQDCNGNDLSCTATWYKDADGDGYSDGTAQDSQTQPAGYFAASSLTALTGDCDDDSLAVHPGATETCGDGIDQDCDGNDLICASTWYKDADGDKYSDGTTQSSQTQPTGYFAASSLTALTGDCDDNSLAVHPGATEICGDGIDQDCDGNDLVCASTWYKDADGDNYSDGTTQDSQTQPSGYFAASSLASLTGDCDDTDAAVNPGALENCTDGKDNDCSGQTDCDDNSCIEDTACATSQTGSYPVPDTGQTKCYGSTGLEITCPSQGSSLFGQDAQYSSSGPSYTDNGDDTVTDNVTGLMWQKTFAKVDWADAQSNAASTSTGGYTDWRVPTIKELYSLIDFSGATGMADPSSTTAPADAVPYIDTASFDFEYSPTGRYIDSQYITSTTYTSTVVVNANMGDQEVFFGVNFADGRIKGYPKTGNPSDSTFYARWVRGNTAFGMNDFKDNGDNTVTDNATSLRWMKYDSGHTSLASSLAGYDKNDGSLDWEEALNFCESLTFAGRSDWRLPDAHELQSIVDYTRSPDATGSAAIDPIFDATAISVEDGSNNYPFYWTGTSHNDGQGYAVYVTFGEAFGFIEDNGQYVLSDVHGAGAQRSDPKSGDPADYPTGHGPQGDVVRIYNYVRCVCSE